jgi:hypothetical protein
MKVHEAFVRDNDRSSYLIELDLRVFKHSEQYKNIFLYWQSKFDVTENTKKWIFFLQLERWRMFRQFQQKNRRFFVFHDQFLEFQQKVLERRQKHELDDDVQLLENRNKQSKLNDWMKYQNYELRTYERFEQDFKKIQTRLTFRRKTLTKTKILTFEKIQKLEFVNYYSLIIECEREKKKAKKKWNRQSRSWNWRKKD